MTILTRDRLTTLTEGRLGKMMFSRTVNEARNQSKTTATVTVFLSHSHDDLDNPDVNKVISLLRQTGVRVYVDSLDSSLPPFASEATATKIKNEIRTNKKFILLATNRAVLSRWCNWELGYGDAFKYIDNIAIIPLADNSSDWIGNEYITIYPRIEESPLFNDRMIVTYPSGQVVNLSA